MTDSLPAAYIIENQLRFVFIMMENKKTPVQEEETSVSRFFESNTNLGTVETRVENEDTRTQKQNLAVIKKLLEMFNLEETKRKYETQNVVEYVLDPNDFGYDW